MEAFNYFMNSLTKGYKKAKNEQETIKLSIPKSKEPIFPENTCWKGKDKKSKLPCFLEPKAKLVSEDKQTLLTQIRAKNFNNKLIECREVRGEDCLPHLKLIRKITQDTAVYLEKHKKELNEVFIRLEEDEFKLQTEKVFSANFKRKFTNINIQVGSSYSAILKGKIKRHLFEKVNIFSLEKRKIKNFEICTTISEHILKSKIKRSKRTLRVEKAQQISFTVERTVPFKESVGSVHSRAAEVDCTRSDSEPKEYDNEQSSPVRTKNPFINPVGNVVGNHSGQPVNQLTNVFNTTGNNQKGASPNVFNTNPHNFSQKADSPYPTSTNVFNNPPNAGNQVFSQSNQGVFSNQAVSPNQGVFNKPVVSPNQGVFNNQAVSPNQGVFCNQPAFNKPNQGAFNNPMPQGNQGTFSNQPSFSRMNQAPSNNQSVFTRNHSSGSQPQFGNRNAYQPSNTNQGYTQGNPFNRR